jgi:hypothetical protein
MIAGAALRSRSGLTSGIEVIPSGMDMKRGRKKGSAARKPARTTRSPASGRKEPARGKVKTGSLLLRDIDPDVLEVIRNRARRSGRSLQQELHLSLRRDARRNFDEARAAVDSWHAKLAGRDMPDSLALIREDRER